MSGLRKVVLATTNANKVRELAGPLAELGVELLGLSDFPEIGEIVEDGATFEENSRIKAAAVAKATGLVAIADDSGLEVDALNGAPGVHSSRYADELPLLDGETRDARNIRKLLDALKDIEIEKHTARFVCCMTAVDPNSPDDILVARGEWEGVILDAPVGSNGFGYDPVFMDAEIGFTAAQLTREEKLRQSHRGKAVRDLLKYWPEWIAVR